MPLAMPGAPLKYLEDRQIERALHEINSVRQFAAISRVPTDPKMSWSWSTTLRRSQEASVNTTRSAAAPRGLYFRTIP
jgi:hypothetical protein